MKILFRSEIPWDYHYYRSHSKAYFDYIIHSEWKHVVKVEENGGYGYIHHYFWWFFSIAFFEKCDIQPTKELLIQYGMKRGIVFWSGWKMSSPTLAWESKDIFQKWWIRLGYYFSHLYHHSTRSAFSLLNTREYWKKWSSKARWHRNKIFRELEEWKIIINTDASLEDFLEVYKKTKIHHKWKAYNIWRQKFLSKNYSANIRIYTASVDWVILAGAIFLDDHPTSTYLIAFQDDAGKSYHLGLALIDRWFFESQKVGYKYLDLDHMRDSLDPLSYEGYTKFKSEIADYELRWREVWVKIMI